MDENDGRPPDTPEALRAFDAASNPTPKKITKKVKFSQSPSSPEPSAQVPPPRELISYQWSGGNSCFFDVGLALWFNAFKSWSAHDRDTFIKSLPHGTVFASIFNHYERRRKWLATGHGGLTEGRRELLLGQQMARHGIFKHFDLYEHSRAFGCSKTWLQRGVSVSIICPFTMYPCIFI
jgi:hypothetical protein